jgi:hypothetical protein
MKTENTAFTGQLIGALTTGQTNFSDSTALLEKLGLTPSQFMVVRGCLFAAAEIYLEMQQGTFVN